MNGFRINFTLKQPGEIAPFGEKGRYSLSWFGLTDGLLWIAAGDKTIYEYSDAAMKEWGGETKYDDYYLSRFLEDFSAIFASIAEPVSREHYDSVEEFEERCEKQLEQFPNYDDDPEEFERLYDEYLEQRAWFSDRVFDSGHLKGGPIIGCFCCEDRLKLYWNGDVPLESGESIWTAPRGSFEMPYEEFAAEVKRFFAEFYREMDEQVKRALERDWGEIAVDKERLVQENAERRLGFDQKLSRL